MWLAFLAPVAAVGLLVAAALTTNDAADQAGGQAVDFVLPDTDGGTVTLADVLADGDALLYFSMGVGCDGCFLQIPEIADQLDQRGITLVPIMVDGPDRHYAEMFVPADRFFASCPHDRPDAHIPVTGSSPVVHTRTPRCPRDKEIAPCEPE